MKGKFLQHSHKRPPSAAAPMFDICSVATQLFGLVLRDYLAAVSVDRLDFAAAFDPASDGVAAAVVPS